MRGGEGACLEAIDEPLGEIEPLGCALRLVDELVLLLGRLYELVLELLLARFERGDLLVDTREVRVRVRVRARVRVRRPAR